MMILFVLILQMPELAQLWVYTLDIPAVMRVVIY